MADTRAVLELIVEFEKALDQLEEFGVGGEKEIGRVKEATADLRKELEGAEVDTGALESKARDLETALGDLGKGGEQAAGGVGQAAESTEQLSLNTIELGAKLLIGLEAVKQFNRAGEQMSKGLGEVLGNLGLAEEKVESFTEILSSRFNFNPFDELTTLTRAWLGTLSDGEELLRKAADAGIPFADGLADIANNIRVLTGDLGLNNEELERYNENLAKGEAFLERRAAALDKVRDSVVGDVEGLRLQAGALEQVNQELEESGKLSEERLKRIGEQAVKLRDEMVSLGVDVPPKVRELAEAFEAGAKAAEDNAKASESAAESIEKVGEKSTGAAQAQRDLAEAGQQAAQAQVQLSEDAERALTILDRLSAAQDRGGDGEAGGAQASRERAETAGDEGQRVEELRLEYEELKGAVSLTAEQQNRLDIISVELQAAQIALRESGAAAAAGIQAQGAAAAAAEVQVAGLRNISAEEAAIIGELVGEVELADSAHRTYAEAVADTGAAQRDQTIAGEDLLANTEGLRQTTSDLILAERLGLTAKQDSAAADRDGAAAVGEKIETLRDAEGNIIGYANASRRAKDSTSDLADAERDLADAAAEGSSGIQEQAEAAKDGAAALDELLERVEKLERASVKGFAEGMERGLKAMQQMLEICPQLQECIGKIGDEL